MLNHLLDAATRLRAGGDPAYSINPATDMSEHEFVLAMMLQLEVCKWSQVRPFIKKFRMLDADGSGKLGLEDLNKLVTFTGSADELQVEVGAMRQTAYAPQPPQYHHPY
jgi:hypothetical protein